MADEGDLLCPVSNCRAGATEPVERNGLVVFMACKPHRDELVRTNLEGWIVQASAKGEFLVRRA